MKTKSAVSALMVLLTLLLISCVTQEQLIIEEAVPTAIEPVIRAPVELELPVVLELSETPPPFLIDEVELEVPIVVEPEFKEVIAIEVAKLIDLIEEDEQELPLTDSVRFTNATATQFHHILLPIADQLDFDDILSGSVLEEQDSFELELEHWPYLQKVIKEGISEPLEIYVWTADGSMLFRQWSPLAESWVIVLGPEDFLE